MTDRKSTPAPDADLEAHVAAHVAATDKRISRITHQGQVVWIKQREKPGLVLRLQKGDPAVAFAAERAAMQQLRTAGVPVPKILAQGEDFFATADCGAPLDYILRTLSGTVEERTLAFAAAGAALAAIHAAQLSHGRPSIKDICWQDGRITFLDFERFAAKRNSAKGHREDLILMISSAYSVTNQTGPEIDALMAGYRAHDPAGIWQSAETWCRKMRWLIWATKPFQWRRAGKSREFKAVPLTLAAFGVG